MRILKSTTSLTPIALLFAPAALHAQASISTAITTPVRSSTANNGAAADINVTSTGSVTVNAGAAVTIDSNNSLTNAGTIAQGAADNVIGVSVAGGTTSTITNSGTISVLESFNAPNLDGNSIVDGPIAQASNRTGVLFAAGTHSGNFLNTGTVTVEGLNSAGVRISGPLTGSFLNGGTIKVRGDGSVGVQTQNVSGNVVIGGPLTVVGKGATALDITGDVGGYVRIVNNVGQAASFTDDNASVMTLQRSDLNVGAAAASIAGNVGGGIIIATAPTTSSTNADNDGDGVPDTSETNGSIQSYGNGPALRVGNASRDITIGAVSGDGHGIVIAGTVTGSAFYSSNNTTGLQIGGLGGNVTVTGGIKVSGTLQAGTVDAGATALLINAGSSVPVVDVTGKILATISSPGQGSAYGIRDLSGTLTTVNNSGFITASGTAQDTTAAIDLSANTTGVTITQTAPSGTASGTATATLSGITGNIKTGSGNDVLTVSGGSIVGNAAFGAGNDSLSLSNDAVYNGKADFGTGTATITLANTSKMISTLTLNNQLATMTINDTAQFSGGVVGGSNLTVNVNGGTLEATDFAGVNFKTLNVGANGTIKIDINATNHTSTKFNVDTATFASGSKVSATVNSLADSAGTYTILSANTITGTPSLVSDQTVLPYLFKGTVSLSGTGKDLILNISRKTASEVGLGSANAQAYDAILAAAPVVPEIAQSLLGATDQATLKTQMDQLLPDHAGGNFDLLTRGSRLATRHLMNNNSMFDISNLGGWIEPIKYTGSKYATGTAGYDTSGFDLSMGAERDMGFGHLGVLFNWMSGSNKNRTNTSQEVKANAYEFGGFWRISSGPFYAFLRGTYTTATFKSTRAYSGKTGAGVAFSLPVAGNWSGRMWSGAGGVSYQVDLGDRLAVKPMATFDYYRLHERGYTETGAEIANVGDAIDLTVLGRTSKSATATTTVTGIYRFGPRTKEGIPLTLEVEGGRRNQLNGTLGATTAHFANGNNFSISPDKLESQWLGEARLLSGGLDYTWTLAAGAETTQGKPSYNVRFSLAVAF